MVKYHLGWKLALNLKLWADGFHPTTLVHFRQRLLEAGKSGMAFGVVLKSSGRRRLYRQALQATLGLHAYTGSRRPDERFGMCA
jgi:hypothetical protein